MYELVSKKEYKPFREEIELIIRKVQKILREEKPKITFQFKLVGSGSRHLITRIKDGNTGYDFDYNLIANINQKTDPAIREHFFQAFQKAIKNSKFNKIENSKSVITIKSVSKKNSKVLVGCDFSIICYSNKDLSYHYFAKFNKKENNYIWNIRSISKDNNKKLLWLKNNYSSFWNELKKEYLKLKNNDKQNKHSFILYYESINNIYNKYY